MSIKAGKVVTNLDRTTHVLLWARGLQKHPTVEKIQRRWLVSRATGYRWLPKLIDAREIWAMQQRRPMSRQPYESTADALPLEGLLQ